MSHPTLNQTILSRFLTNSRHLCNLGQHIIKDIKTKASTMADLSYKIRPLKEADIPGVLEIIRANKFQYPLSGLRSWMTFDPEGILVAVSSTGTVMGVCSCVKNSEKIYFGGSFCVKEEYRNLDLGDKLFAHCFEHAKSQNIGCNSTSDMLNSYKRRGFCVFERNWSSLEYETYEHVNPGVLVDSLPEDVEIKPYHDTLFPAIIAYDYALVKFDRTEILDMSVHEDDALTLVALKGRTCVGFGSIKFNIQGAGRVGPLYADDPTVGETMLKRLIIGMPQAKGLAMVTVSNNLHANDCLKRMGMMTLNSLLRVYMKTRLSVDTTKIYAQFDVDFSSF